MTSQLLLSWRASTHERVHRSPDWFWALALLALTGAIASFLLDNILLSVIIILGAIIIFITAVKDPRLCDIHITPEGILVEHSLFPYRSLNSFWVDEETSRVPQLIVGTKSLLNPQLVLPLEATTTPDQVREVLRKYLPEEEQYETAFDRVADFLGF